MLILIAKRCLNIKKNIIESIVNKDSKSLKNIINNIVEKQALRSNKSVTGPRVLHSHLFAPWCSAHHSVPTKPVGEAFQINKSHSFRRVPC